MSKGTSSEVQHLIAGAQIFFQHSAGPTSAPIATAGSSTIPVGNDVVLREREGKLNYRMSREVLCAW